MSIFLTQKIPILNNRAHSIRPFIGCKDYQQSQEFYRLLGFEVLCIGQKMCVVKIDDQVAFYLQDFYTKDWVDNTMLFLEVEDVEAWHKKINSLDIVNQYPLVRCSEIVIEDWGKEFFLHDPEGILWHIGKFN